ncbi:MAG: GNAT family N-acetyltransferase [Gordonia sp. (in: high G+C Gram-positive bacteria)]
MDIRPASNTDIDAITVIYNHAVEHTTAIWNERIVDAADRQRWLADRQAAGFPVLVATEPAGEPGDGNSGTGRAEVLGYATYGPWRNFDGFRHTVEHSVYVREDRQGKGIGTSLMTALIGQARTAGIHVMVAAIEAGNSGSIGLHEKLGFTPVGMLPEVGTKFDRWLDLAFLQLTL